MWCYLKVQNWLAWFVWYEKLISLDSIYKSRKLMCKLCFFVWWVNVNVVSYTFNVIVNLFKYRSSHRRYFVRKGVLSLKKETLGTVVFVWVLRNFKNTFFSVFYRTHPVDTVWTYSSMKRSFILCEIAHYIPLYEENCFYQRRI